jgi:hypothetical protein
MRWRDCSWRALVLSGDTAKARRTYDDLFALWKDADAGIPVITESRADYARLAKSRWIKTTVQ